MEILRASHLCKTYGKGENEVRALDDVCFSIEKGEFVAIVGTSGSGKSTLMHILGGVDRPDSGSVYMDGQDIRDSFITAFVDLEKVLEKKVEEADESWNAMFKTVN